MIYNLLHIEQPEKLLKEAGRILKPGGTVSVIHWRSDIETPAALLWILGLPLSSVSILARVRPIILV